MKKYSITECNYEENDKKHFRVLEFSENKNNILEDVSMFDEIFIDKKCAENFIKEILNKEIDECKQ